MAIAVTAVAGPMVGGFLSGLITGGDLKSAMLGALTGAMFSGVGSMSMDWGSGIFAGIGKTLAHGVVGGISSKMGGGSFKSGFLSAGFTQGISQIKGFEKLGLGSGETTGSRFKNAFAAALVGGTASVIGGGQVCEWGGHRGLLPNV